MSFEKLQEIKENIQILADRLHEIPDLKILTRGLDKKGHLEEDFNEVEIIEFRRIQNTLISKKCFPTALLNYRNMSEQIDSMPPKLENLIEKLLLLIDRALDKNLEELHRKSKKVKKEVETIIEEPSKEISDIKDSEETKEIEKESVKSEEKENQDSEKEIEETDPIEEMFKEQ